MTSGMKRSGLAIAITGLCLAAGVSQASSHREAPFITENPKVDGSDFYMFRSYETNRDGFVTMIANYLPLQDAFGGPNYFDLDEGAVYEIHVDKNGDARENLTFQFKFSDILNDIQLPVGPDGDQKMVSVPLDNIGAKSFADYGGYADSFVHDIAIPGCSVHGRVFVGQRKEAFAVNLGEIYDLVNTNFLGPRDGAGAGDLANKNVTSLALEVPTDCLTGSAQTASGDPVIGAWTTASLRQIRVINPNPKANGKGASIEGGAYAQVSRLGMPLVNEVVIGLKDKDGFNASEPKDDGQFLTYVTHPALPELLEILFADAGAKAPDNFPRTDLVTAFLTGVPDLNQPAGVTASEMLRLNPAILAIALASQNDLGVLGGDNAGFPNGRRPVDDVVDIALRVVMGALITDAPNRDAPFTDGVQLNPAELKTSFPYLATPVAGSPNS